MTHDLGAAWCWASIQYGDDVSGYSMDWPAHWPTRRLHDDPDETGDESKL